MMMAAFKLIDKPIEIADGKTSVLIIENKKLFRNVIASFENCEEEEYFTFSEDFKPFVFSKKGMFIPDVVNVDLNNKKLSAKINQFLEENANTEFFKNIETIKSEMICLGDKLTEFADFDCEYDFDIATADIIKILGFKIGSPSRIPIDNFVAFIKLMAKYLKVRFFVIPYMHIVFDSEELALIYEAAALEHINLLSVECLQPEEKQAVEEFIIIDKSLCVIDSNDI